MKSVVIILMLAICAWSFSGDPFNGTMTDFFKPDKKQAEIEAKYTKYKVTSVSDGPIVNIQKITAVPNPKKMGEKTVATTQIAIAYGDTLYNDRTEMEASKKFLAATLSGHTIKVVSGDRGPATQTVDNAGGIAITTTKSRRFDLQQDILMEDGKRLSDLYGAWLDKRQAERKSASAPGMK